MARFRLRAVSLAWDPATPRTKVRSSITGLRRADVRNDASMLHCEQLGQRL